MGWFYIGYFEEKPDISETRYVYPLRYPQPRKNHPVLKFFSDLVYDLPVPINLNCW